MFTYVKNNPILYVDPSGYVGFFASMAIGFAVEAALTLGFPMLKVIPFLIDILAELITMVIIDVLNKLEALYGITPETIITIAITAVAGGLALGFLAKKIGPLLKGKKAIAEAAEEGMEAIGDVAKKADNAPLGGITSKADDVVEDTANKTIRNTSGTKGKTGSYVIEFESGNTYTGKGAQSRMQTSAKRLSNMHNDAVVSMKWEPAIDNRTAFIDEYRKMMANGGPLSMNSNAATYNKINSPGRKYYIQDLTDLFK